jgi:hypothetical protein
MVEFAAAVPDGDPVKTNALPGGFPILVGPVVCSHKADASDTVVFSDVSVEQLAPPAGRKQ